MATFKRGILAVLVRLVLVSGLLGLHELKTSSSFAGAAYFVLNPKYGTPEYRGTRTAVFIALGLSALIPVTHLVFTHGLHELMTEMGINWLLLSGALYIGGALL